MKNIIIFTLLFLVQLTSNGQNNNSKRLTAITLNPYNGYVATGSVDEKVTIWDESGNRIKNYFKPSADSFSTKMIVVGLYFLNEDNDLIVSTLMDSYLAKSTKSELVPLKNGYLVSVDAFSVTKNNNIIRTKGFYEILITDVNGKVKKSIPYVVQNVSAFPNDTTKFVVGSSVNGITVMTINGSILKNFPDLKANEKIIISPDEKYFSLGNRIVSFDGKTNLSLEVQNPTSVLFTNDSQFIYTSDANLIKKWSIGGNLISTTTYKNTIQSMLLAQKDKTLLIGSSDGSLEQILFDGTSIISYK